MRNVATTIPEAAACFDLATRQDVWDTERAPGASLLPSPDEVYVDRSIATADGEAPASRPFLTLKRRLMRSLQRILVFGQIGSGKSMELRHFTRDPQLIERYEVLSLSLADHLNLLADANVRLVLLAIAEAVARRLKDGHNVKATHWGFAKDDEGAVREWLRILAPEDSTSELPDPSQVNVRDLVSILDARLKDLNAAIRSDERTRQDIIQGERFRPQQVRDLVSSLVLLLAKKAQKDVLLVVDDGDKVGRRESAESIFVRDLPLLMELPAAMIVTVPFWLRFDPMFDAAARPYVRLATANATVVDRDKPGTLPEPGRRFFRALYERLADRSLVEDAALDEAARLSAGVPRSFVRLMFEAFDLADARDLSKLDLATLKSAAAGQRREMLAATQHDEVRAALGRVRQTKTLSGTREWQLLNALLIVEYTNDYPWYDVNPLLQRDADAWKPQT